MVKKKILKIGILFSAIVLGIFLLITGGLYFFKDEICGYVISEVNVHLKAKVKVAKVDLAFWGSFPNLSVDFNQVFIQDSYKNSTEKDTLLYSDRIRLKFNPMDIWNEKYNVKAIDISPGTINLKINSKLFVKAGLQSEFINLYLYYRNRRNENDSWKQIWDYNSYTTCITGYIILDCRVNQLIFKISIGNVDNL